AHRTTLSDAHGRARRRAGRISRADAGRLGTGRTEQYGSLVFLVATIRHAAIRSVSSHHGSQTAFGQSCHRLGVAAPRTTGAASRSRLRRGGLMLLTRPTGNSLRDLALRS